LVESNDVKVGTGYGHLCFLAEDIYGTCKNMTEKGENVVREPGAVKGGTTVIAFVLDPEGKKIEYIQNSKERTLTSEFNHIMIRVGDLEKSVEFYKSLGMKELNRSVNEQYKYTLSFVGFESSETVLELTYNWDTSSYEMGDALESITILSDKDEEIIDPTGYKIKLVSKE
jgi:catechol 2,3-dioxygenase-like lactoylglutathione lyase family enzyme